MRKLSLIVALFATMLMGVYANNTKLSPLTRSYLLDRASNEVRPESKYATKTVRGVEYISAYVHFYGEIDKSLLEDKEVLVDAEFASVGIVTARIPVENLEAVAALSEVEYIEMGAKLYSTLDKARVASMVNDVHQALAPLDTTYTGKGVIVGIVDHGFEYAHINFQDSEGNLRVKRIWEQTWEGTPPEGFTYGNELKTPEDIIAAGFDAKSEDRVGHGAHVAGIAAGSDNNRNNKYYGVAPEAELVFVSIDLESDVALINSLQYIYDYATEQGKPCVVNFSLGTYNGPHDGTSTFDVLSSEMQGEGRLLVGAIGNDGSSPMHVDADLNSASDTLKAMIDFKYADYSNIIVWGEEGEDIGVQIVLVNRTTRKEIYASEILKASANTTVQANDFNLSNVEGSITIVAEESSALNGKPNFDIVLDLYRFKINGASFAIKVFGKGKVHAWSDALTSYFLLTTLPGWELGTDNYTASEVGGTGKRIISVGSYTSHSPHVSQRYGDVSSFSSKGPTVDERRKPDVLAPGSVITSSLPGTPNVLQSMPIVHENEVDGKKYYYGNMSGTSQAAPFVTGVLALWLQANPDLTPEMVKEVLEHNSIRDGFYGNEVPNNTFGAGKINAFAGLTYILGLTTDNENVEHDAMMVYPNPTVGEFNIGFVKDDKNVSVDVYNMAGQKVMSEHIETVNAANIKVFSLAGVENGVYTVRVRGDKMNQSFRLLVTK